MPIPAHTNMAAVPGILAKNVATYNATVGGTYNPCYAKYIDARNAGVVTAGCLSAWLAESGAAHIQTLLSAFGMNRQNSRLVPEARFQMVLSELTAATIDWVAGFALPLSVAPPNRVNDATGQTLAAELQLLYEYFRVPHSVTESGGFVAASKTMHCLFPELAPIIDGAHTGTSYFRINSATYRPPLAIASWDKWVGASIRGKPNPSPQGGGRNGWSCQRFLAALGVNQSIYELWQGANENQGLQAFLALDPTPGTTGIPRVIDKGLW